MTVEVLQYGSTVCRSADAFSSLSARCHSLETIRKPSLANPGRSVQETEIAKALNSSRLVNYSPSFSFNSTHNNKRFPSHKRDLMFILHRLL